LTLGAGKRVQIEFVSANPTGPLTLGISTMSLLDNHVYNFQS